MKNFLLIVDLQKGFTRKKETSLVADRINSLLNLKLFDTVVATRFLNPSDSPFERFMGWEGLRNSVDQKLVIDDKIKLDYVYGKTSYGIADTYLLEWLTRYNGNILPEKIFVAGVDTDACVLTIATELFDRGVRPVVLSEYCHSNGGVESHLAGIKCLERLVGKGQIVDKLIVDRGDLNV